MKTYLELLEEALPDPTHPNHDHWKRYYLSGVERGRAVVEKLKAIRPLEGARVLDFGCGDGGHAIALARAGAYVTALDIDERCLERAGVRAKEYGAVVLFCRELLRENSYDIICCIDTLEHVSQPAYVAKLQAAFLAPGGVLYLTVPNRWSVKNLRSDPHYQLPGLSILGPRLGKILVGHICKRVAPQNYGVNRLFGWRDIHRLYLSAGIRLERPHVPWLFNWFVAPAWEFLGTKTGRTP